jgi:CHAD domain-containing protein
MSQPASRLHRPAFEAARSVARDYLDQLVDAQRRLAKGDDPDALHDFRVALRRLRGTLRAFRPQLRPVVSRRTRRRLRRLARATGASRDLQVQRQWVMAQVPALRPEEQPGGDWLIARIAARERLAAARLDRRVKRVFEPLHRKLRHAVAGPGHGAARGTPGRSERAEDLLLPTVRHWATELRRELRAIHTIADWAEAHSARMTVKRVRYLLEPFAKELSAGETTIARLTELQDLLGALQDAHALTEELRAGLSAVAVQEAGHFSDEALLWPARDHATEPPADAGTRAGLMALAWRLRRESEAAFAGLQTWLDQHGAELLTALRQLTSERPPGHPRRSSPPRSRHVAVSS